MQPNLHLSGAILLASMALTSIRGAAQAPTISFPFTVTATSADQVQLQPSVERLARLALLQRATMIDVPVPGQGTVNLRLERVDLHLADDAIHVDGVPSRRGIDPLLSMWRGSVVGAADSQVFLAFSPHGSRGWFGVAGDFRHLLAEPGPGGDWSRSRSRIVTQRFVQSTGYNPKMDCATLHPSPGNTSGNSPGNSPAAAPRGGAAHANSATFIDAPIAFETDFEFYALFNDLPAAQTYAFTLIGAVSDRYREQMDVIFTLPYVGFYTQNNDPWSSTDCSGRLSQFRSAWSNGKAPKRAELYHMISGVRVSGCGGVAYVNVICNQGFGFAMSAHINARMPFPPAQGPLTWDFMVIAHESGHQFGSPHTHSYSPPIDNCATQSPCISNGTNMSYCHTCPGGMNNMTLRFHPRVITVIRAAVASSCLRPFHGVIAKDLGFALRGSNGTPVQQISYASSSVTVQVTSAPRQQPGLMIFGARRIDVPLFGGTLVPNPSVLIPVMTNSVGDFRFALSIPGSYPLGVIAYLQSWIQDPNGTNPFAATNAIQAELIKP